jgi:hypothetical protein
MKRVFALGLAVLALGGCKSRPLSVCVSPRMTGRVLAADTGQPLADVKIITSGRTEDYNRTAPPKGGQVLKSKPTVRTDRDGRFVLESERVLAPFSGSGWFSVQFFIDQPGYERFLTNYSYLNLRTNTWKGKPVLETGDIRLQPTAK